MLTCIAVSGEISLSGTRVLLLYSYHPGFPTSPQTLAGIRSVFQSGEPLIDIEYMDSKRLDTRQSRDNFYRQFSYKLAHREPYDLIVTADDNALDFVVGQGDALFGEIPKVFLGVNNLKLAHSMASRMDVTGVVEAPSFSDTLSLAKRIFPLRDSAYILVDGTASGQADLATFREVIAKEKDLDFKILSLAELTWDEFSTKLRAHGSDALIFLISAYRDSDEKALSFEKSLQLIRNETEAPIFHFWRHGMRNGVLGGVIINHYEQGRQAALLAEKILSGISVSSLPVIRNSPNVPTLDFSLATSYGVDPTLLPEETQWINLPEQSTNQYKTYFLYTLLGLASLFIVVLILIPLLSKYRQLNRAVAKSEEQYRTIVENSHDGIWQIDDEGVTTFVNHTMAEMFGYAVDEMLGRSFYDFMDDEAKQIAQKNLDRRRSGISESHEFRFLHKEGHDIWTRMNTSSINDDQGRFIGALALVNDITESREESLRLKQSEEKFNQLTQAIREVFWIGSPDLQQVYYVSPAYEMVWGRSCQSLYNKATSWIEALPREDLVQVESFLAEHLQKPWDELHFPEYRVIRPDGEVSWVDAKAFAIYDESGELYRVAGIAEDITRRKSNEFKLNHRLELEKLIANQAAALLGASAGELDHRLNALLELIGEFSGSDRAYLFQFDEMNDTMSNTHEWCGSGVESKKESLQKLDLSEFGYMLGLFSMDKPLFIGSLTELPPEADHFRKHLMAQQIKSVLAVPLKIDRNIVGFIGFDAVSQTSIWQQEDVLLLQTFSGVIASAIKRHGIEAALRESRRATKTLLDNLPGAAYRCLSNEQWSMLFLSDGIKHITSYEPDELVDNRLLSYADLVHPTDRSQVADQVADAISRKRPFEIEYRLFDRWRREHWVLEKGAMVESSTSPCLIEGFISDITERKHIEKALQMSEENLQLIMNSTAESIYGLDDRGICTSVNRAGLRQLGYEDESELVGRPMHRIIHHSHADGSPYPAAECPIFKAFHLNEQIHRDDEVFWRKDGTSFPVEYWSYPLINERGAVVTFIDITQRKFTEQVMESRIKLLDYAPGHDVHELLVYALDEACEKTGSKIGFYHFIDEDQRTLSLQAWSTRTTDEYCQMPGEGLHYDVDEAGVWADAVRERQPVIHNDYITLPNRQGLPPGHAELSCELCVPVFRGQRIVGVMGVGNRSLQNYNEADVDMVSRIADLVWDIVENKQIEAQLVQSRKQLSTILDTVTEAVALWDEQARLRYANPVFYTLMHIPVTLWEREAGIGRTLTELVPNKEIAKDIEQTLYQMLDTGESVENLQLQIDRGNDEIVWIRMTIHALYDGTNSGITGAVSTISDITEQKSHEQQLEQLAHFDGLTGLPNRLLAIDRLRQMIARAKRSGELMAVCYLDLDGFKEVNDTQGHEAGDQLLKETANRLTLCVRNGDTVARLGGDEFLILLGDLRDQQEARLILERILELTAKPYEISGTVQATVTASLGVTLFPNDNSEPDQLVRHGDQAMYMAKESGKNCYQFFSRDFEQRIRAQEETLSEIIRAMDSDQLIVYYQPVIDCREGKVIAAEALIRWDHPILGLLEPAEFLPLINKSDIMLSISRQVIDQAVVLIDHIHRMGASLYVGINLFPEQSYDPSFLNMLSQYVAQLSQRRKLLLQIEISERVTATHFSQTEKFINACLEMGIDCVLDDFGVGDTSIQKLSQLPVRTIKIDRALTQAMLSDERKYALIHSILSMAKAFNRMVIIQGVEEERQMATLLSLGCSRMQGYLFSEAMPSEEFSQWLASTIDSPDWLKRFATM
ncbi:MAG: PAS domain S-box protein [Candidatus Thiodiazotropha sp. (ex Monitilora ramsayi)]|nr:PAS domain S-box protein [Candidatus Thiodiazotropha sp. (ex Monitilora ramsayi)]